MPAKRFRLITVDLDETVWPCAPVIMAAEQATHAWLADAAARLAAAHDIDSMRRHRRCLLDTRPEIAHDVSALRLASLRLLLAEFGYPESLAEQAAAVFLQHRNRIDPYADAAPALLRLRQRYHVIALTNGNSDPEQTPLRGLFHDAITAAEAGSAKPAPEMFEMAMSRVGVGAAQTLHLGDDPWLDVEAARQIGLTAVWVNRGGQQWPAELEPPVLEVRELDRVLAWLES